jgi:hypothetical protein
MLNEKIYYKLQFQKISEDFNNLKRFVTFSKSNFKTYSNEITDLILRIAIEVENISKTILTKSNKVPSRKFPENINSLNKIYLLDKKELFLQDFIIDNSNYELKYKPFEKSKVKKNYSKPEFLEIEWFIANNKLKHNRILNQKLGNFKNLIDAFGSYYVLYLIYNYYDIICKVPLNDITLDKIVNIMDDGTLVLKIFGKDLIQNAIPQIFFDHNDLKNKRERDKSLFIVHRPEKRFGRVFGSVDFDSEWIKNNVLFNDKNDPIKILYDSIVTINKQLCYLQVNSLWFFQLNTFHQNHNAVKISIIRNKNI